MSLSDHQMSAQFQDVLGNFINILVYLNVKCYFKHICIYNLVLTHKHPSKDTINMYR
jgi:hypothetical protein